MFQRGPSYNEWYEVHSYHSWKIIYYEVQKAIIS